MANLDSHRMALMRAMIAPLIRSPRSSRSPSRRKRSTSNLPVGCSRCSSKNAPRRASRAKAEAEKADLGARLEALETALALERERATVAEGEAKLLLERALRAEVMMLDDR
jgi:hypothetical protein